MEGAFLCVTPLSVLGSFGVPLGSGFTFFVSHRLNTREPQIHLARIKLHRTFFLTRFFACPFLFLQFTYDMNSCTFAQKLVAPLGEIIAPCRYIKPKVTFVGKAVVAFSGSARTRCAANSFAPGSQSVRDSGCNSFRIK